MSIIRNNKLSKYLLCFRCLIVTLFVFGATITMFAQKDDSFKLTKIGKKDKKHLKDKFGIQLPKVILANRKYILKESGVTYLLVKMEKKDADLFIESTKKAVRLTGVMVEIQDEVCRANKNCMAIGNIFSPSDAPEEAIDEWKKKNGFDSDTLATFSFIKNGRLQNYASFYFDSKNGLLMLWYKV